jgi:Icc-related predicted phosphoesterase
VSDLHGQVDRYQKLFDRMIEERPAAVFLGGDLLPHGLSSLALSKSHDGDFIKDFLTGYLKNIRNDLGDTYPEIFVILGNDDERIFEPDITALADQGLWNYIHEQKSPLGAYSVYGYACVPPSPLQLKDWERFDVSRHVDPGCIPPTEGWRSVPVERHKIEYGTIAKDLEKLAGNDSMERSVCLFHSPPYQTRLDRAALDGMMIDHVPLDVHIGSIAIERFIKKRQPLIALHGHVHESARLTGRWRDIIGETWCFTAAHDGPELALVRFDLDHPEDASRELI